MPVRINDSGESRKEEPQMPDTESRDTQQSPFSDFEAAQRQADHEKGEAERQESREGNEIVTTGKSQQPEMTLLLAPEAQSNPAVQDVLKNITLKLKTWRGTEIEVPLSEIHIGAPVQHQGQAQRYTICGNCGKRLPYSHDPQENHHTAQRHKLECAKRDQALNEHTELVKEFESQPNVAAMRALYAQQQREGIEGYVRVENLPPSGGPLRLPSAPSALARPTAQPPAPAQRRWWQFWRPK
jgi:hypothetical protein